MIQIRDLEHFPLRPVEILRVLGHDTLAVAERQVLKAIGEQELRDRNARAARAVHDHLNLFFVLADHLQRIDETREHHDCRSVLIVVEDRNIALFLQLALNFKAARCRNILEVHAAEGTGEQVNRIDNLVHVLGLNAERECIHIAEGLKEHALALHDRHTCLRADVAESENCGAVRHDRAQIPASREFIGLVHVLLNLQAGLCHTRRISER